MKARSPCSKTGSRPPDSIPTNRATTIYGKPERQKICWAGPRGHNRVSTVREASVPRGRGSGPPKAARPHAEHVSERGRVSALTRPVWPQVQAILSIIAAPRRFGADEKAPGNPPSGG
jgi:hypothetical protein